MKVRWASKQVRAISLALLVVLLSAGLGYAQLGGGFDLSWNTIDGGGATFSSGGTYRLGGTGQPDAGTHSGRQL